MLNFILSSFKKNPLVFSLFIISILFSAYIFFFQLGKAPLDNWDEAWHAEMTKEMILKHNFIIPYWNSTPYFDKLPLSMWFSACFSIFFGISELSMRLPSALSGFLLSILLVIHIYKKFGLFPSIVGYSTLVLNTVFLWRARSGNFDTLTAFLIFLVYLVLIDKSKLRLLSIGLLFALIYLTRGAYVVFPIIISILYEIIFRWREFRSNIKGYIGCILISLTIPGIWLWLGYLQSGKAFADFYIFHSDHDVASIAARNLNLDYFKFAYYSLQRYFMYVFIFGLLCLFIKIKNHINFLIFLLSLSLLAFLSFAEKKNNWYLVPSMPFWSIAIAYGVYILLKFFKNNLMVTVLILLVTLYLSYKTFFINIQPIINTTSAIGEATSAKYIKAHSSPNETIVRLDHLFPTYVFYSDRHILVSPSDAGSGNYDYYRSRDAIALLVIQHKIHWLAGQSRDTDYFLQQYPTIPFKKIDINNDEKILEAL